MIKVDADTTVVAGFKGGPIRKMGLLELPPEILQQSLLYCTTPSLFHAIRSCKRLFGVAESSRAVLLHHLEQVPGITLGLQDPNISTHDLFLTLRRRGAAHLVGSNISANCKTFNTANGTMNPNASWLADNTFALALRDNSRVRLYEIGESHCEMKNYTAGCPKFPNCLGKVLKSVTSRGAVYTLCSYLPLSATEEEPSQEQLESHHQSVSGGLEHAYKVNENFESICMFSNACYVVSARQSFSDGEIYFIVSAPAPWLGRVLAPIDFAVHSPLQCAVLWDLPGSIQASIFGQVIKYTATKSPKIGVIAKYKWERIWPLYDRPKEAKSPKPMKVILRSELPDALQHKTRSQPQSLPGPVARTLRSAEMTSLPRSISFAQNGRRIKISAAGSIVPFCVVHLPYPPPTEEDVGTPNPFVAPENPWVTVLHNTVWNLTTAFYVHHATRLTPRAGEDRDNSGEVEQVCTTSYLSLATTKLSRYAGHQQRTQQEVEVLCIMRAIKTLPSNDCTHLAYKDICAPHVYGHGVKAVARLWGWQPSESSLAGEYKTASCDTRIAIAEWDRIFIWSLDPKALLEEADDPISDNIDDNDSNASSDASNDLPIAGEIRKLPAWTYSKIYDDKLKAWYVELMPIVLSTSSNRSGKRGSGRGADVIRQMMWKNPNTLVVRTGSGLQIWNVGPSGTSKRTHQILDPEDPSGGAATDTAATEPEIAKICSQLLSPGGV